MIVAADVIGSGVGAVIGLGFGALIGIWSRHRSSLGSRRQHWTNG